MNRRNAIAPRPRVVVLSRRAELPAPLRDGTGVQASPVGSAYEAAAELLVAPAAAIVVDLNLLTAADARLVKLARELEVEVLAYGTLPAGLGCEQLSGARLLTSDELPDALARSLAAVETPEIEEIELSGPVEAKPRAPELSRAQDLPVVKLTPAKPAESPPREPSQAPITPAPAKPAPRGEGLLSNEELSALLGDKP